MTTREKRLQRLCPAPVEMSYADVALVLVNHGWKEVRQTGSHHLWQGPVGQTVPVSTHGGRTVKREYLKAICILLTGDPARADSRSKPTT